MGKFYDTIPGNLIEWINKQKIFWVATAPLSEDGHINVSPKGFEQTMHVVLESKDDDESATGLDVSQGNVDYKKVTSRAVWYEDLTGSGIETISHARENGRITVMFTAFEGPPMIARLFGTAKIYEFGTPEYQVLLPTEKRQPGSRAIIWVDIHKVGSSCGYSIPFFAYKGPRYRLHKFASGREQTEYDSQSSIGDSGGATATQGKGMRAYWKSKNSESIDGLPGLVSAITSAAAFPDWSEAGARYRVPDDESVPLRIDEEGLGGLVGDVPKILVGFGAGVLSTLLALRLAHIWR